MWKHRIARCKAERRLLVNTWAYNVDYRRGKPFHQETDETRVNVNLDWSLTKSKHAQLFSQVPQVYLTAKQALFKPAVPSFGKELNDTLTRARLGATVDETVLDAINASGVGVALVGYRALTELKSVPTIDPASLPPEIQAQLATGAIQLPMEDVESVVDRQFYVKRLSPSDFLWPLDFAGSDFDDADWLGHSGTMYWAEAQREFKLTDEQKSQVLSTSTRRWMYTLRQDPSTHEPGEPVVEYDELFYWRHRYDVNEKYFSRIYRIVFVEGVEEPVIHEPWKGQEFLDSTYVGACRLPVRVLTFTYISDDAIPPSDSAIGRPQINEMIKSRSQILMQRDRSTPVRWANSDRVDPMVLESLMRGTYQAFVPVQGDGNKVVGEVARAAYPREDFEFDKVIKGDLQEQWQVGSNQLGAFNAGQRSASEAAIVERNFQTRIGYERSRVTAFITGIAEVMAGLLALYGDFPILTPEQLQQMDQAWDRRAIAGEFVYTIRPDSTVRLDADQRVDKLMKLVNLVGKSGFITPKPIIEELVSLHGLDPADVMKEPQPPTPDQPNISYRFSGEDLINPIAVAIMLGEGKPPTPETLEAAKKMLAAAMTPLAPPPAAVPGMGMIGPNLGTPPMPGAGGAVPPTPPMVPPEQTAEARPGWTPMPRVSKRGPDEPGG